MHLPIPATPVHLCKLPSMLPLLECLQCRSGNSVRSKLGEQVERNTRVSRLVKARCGYTTRWLNRATAANLDVDALRIRLRAIRLAGGV